MMSVPTRYNPKRLSDYTIRGGKTRPSRGILSSGPTSAERTKIAAERTKIARDKHKRFVMNDIAASDQRRKALEGMWKAEQDKITSKRKEAVDNYKIIMDTAPDFSEDDDGTMRAAWENQPHVQAAKDQMKAHITASMQQNQGAVSLKVDPNSQEMNKAQFGSKAQPLSPKYAGGFDSTKPAALAPAPDVGEPPERPKQKEITVKLPSGSKGTVVGKKGSKVMVMDRDTREVKEYDQKELEILERKGLDRVTDTPF